jgi:NAD(P)-dependent dehydrogenase (short-subunit alcohol dehydrogenase family)
MSSGQSYKRVWPITGASRGLGAQIVEAALAAGNAVVAAARDTDAIVARFGEHPRVLPVRLDVTDEGQARAVVEMGASHFGRIDVW